MGAQRRSQKPLENELGAIMLDLEAEKPAFRKMYEELTEDESYIEKYVGMLGGKIVDFDSDKLRLVEIVYLELTTIREEEGRFHLRF